jgi:hypothetical protein
MARKTHHVVPSSEGGWDIKRGGAERSSGHFDRKADAIERAREISQHRSTELIIHNRNGRISNAESHGGDPCPPRDKKCYAYKEALR